jgi:hypothetical protein
MSVVFFTEQKQPRLQTNGSYSVLLKQATKNAININSTTHKISFSLFHLGSNPFSIVLLILSTRRIRKKKTKLNNHYQ